LSRCLFVAWFWGIVMLWAFPSYPNPFDIQWTVWAPPNWPTR
jgi:hypothetical protein